MSEPKTQSVQKGLVSVIVTCYNLGEYLGEALESLKNQTYSPIEVIVVDDGSTEAKTTKIIVKLKEKYPDFKFYRISNKGVGGARNYAISKSNGEYICVLDADDKFNSRYISACVDYLQKNKEHSIVTTYVKLFGVTDGTWKTGSYDVIRLCTQNLLHVSSMYRRRVFDDVGGYADVKILSGYQDWDFWLGAVEKGFSWGLIRKELFEYRTREHSMLAGSRKRDMSLFSVICTRHIRTYRKYMIDIMTQQREDNRELMKYGNDVKDKHEKCLSEHQEAMSRIDQMAQDMNEVEGRIDQMALTMRRVERQRAMYQKSVVRLKDQQNECTEKRKALQSELDILAKSRYLQFRNLFLSTRTLSDVICLPRRVLLILQRK